MDEKQAQTGAGRILYCHCAYAQIVPEEVREEVLNRLHASGVSFDAVPDLCALAATRDDRLQQMAAGGALKIVACFPRAVRGLFAAAGAPLPAEGVEILNMRTLPANAVVAGLLGSNGKAQQADDAPAPAGVSAMRAAVQDGPPNGWKPWFPVIDGERCIDCRQCLSFCLFGVFGVSAAGQVEVQKPHNCKTDCPACARVCPEGAIIFPKYETAPINGDEVRSEDVQRESMQVGVPLRLGGDIYQKLRERSAQAKRRFSPEQTEERAMQERQRCLLKHQATLGGSPTGAEPPAGESPDNEPLPSAD